MSQADDRSAETNKPCMPALGKLDGGFAVHVGLEPSGHVPQTPESLELPILDVLYHFGYVGVARLWNRDWAYRTRWNSVPVPVLRAWLRVSPDELSGALERLTTLGYVERGIGSCALPRLDTTQPQGAASNSPSTTELVLEKPDGSHVVVTRAHIGGRDVLLAVGGHYNGTGIDVCDDPGGLTLSFPVRGRAPQVRLTTTGLMRLEESRPKPPVPRTKNKRGRPRLDAEEADRRKRLMEEWQQAKGAGVAQKDFCRDKRITQQALTSALNWVSTRRRRQAWPRQSLG